VVDLEVIMYKMMSQ